MTPADSSPDLTSSVAHFLNDLIEKSVAVTLAGHDQRGQDLIGVLSHVYVDAILLTQRRWVYEQSSFR